MAFVIVPTQVNPHWLQFFLKNNLQILWYKFAKFLHVGVLIYMNNATGVLYIYIRFEFWSLSQHTKKRTHGFKLKYSQNLTKFAGSGMSNTVK